MIVNIVKDIIKTYGSLSCPNWAFLWKNANKHYKLIEDIHSDNLIMTCDSITDYVDYMYDSGHQLCFRYGTTCWWLFLSFVGKYALFSSQIDSKHFRVVDSEANCENEMENIIVSILKNHSIILLPEIITCIKLPDFNLWDTTNEEIPTIRDVLFYHN
jgi:hypothetical protein